MTAKDIKPGSGINISTSGNQVTISYVGDGLGAVAHDNTLTGDGTEKTPPGIDSGTAIKPVDNGWTPIDFNYLYTNGIYTFNRKPAYGLGDAWITGVVLVLRSYRPLTRLCFFNPPVSGKNVAYRQCGVTENGGRPSDDSWGVMEVYCMRNIRR
jgi:hypothetical protein